jgi:hypothetical protein
MGHRRLERGMVLSEFATRCIPAGEMHELVVTDERPGPGDRVERTAFVGFAEFTRGGLLVVGDHLWVGGTDLGPVLGFDLCHMPNHLNVVVHGRWISGEGRGFEVGDPVAAQVPAPLRPGLSCEPVPPPASVLRDRLALIGRPPAATDGVDHRPLVAVLAGDVLAVHDYEWTLAALEHRLAGGAVAWSEGPAPVVRRLVHRLALADGSVVGPDGLVESFAQRYRSIVVALGASLSLVDARLARLRDGESLGGMLASSVGAAIDPDAAIDPSASAHYLLANEGLRAEGHDHELAAGLAAARATVPAAILPSFWPVVQDLARTGPAWADLADLVGPRVRPVRPGRGAAAVGTVDVDTAEMIVDELCGTNDARCRAADLSFRRVLARRLAMLEAG